MLIIKRNMSITLLLLYVVGLSSSVPLELTSCKGLHDVSSNEKCGYESCTKVNQDMLNVHIVPHTHDDVGWLKTVDQYYYGSRNNIQKAGVQYILDSVVKELWQDPKRRFIYVETAFFWMWWVRQGDDVRHKVHTLVRQGRLQFVGGAWSMNDEAASHYQSTIDQFTWGLKKLNETFGPCATPRVGWQIDPFGHSREFASLLAAMGYDGLFLGRIDYQDKRARLSQKRMEMLWRGDDDLGNSSDIFTGALYNTYSPPPGFCFDVLCDDEPIIDDPNSPMFNVEARVTKFIEICRNMFKSYETNNILVTMGEDFQYQDAAMWFINLDKLIQYTNIKSAHDGLNIKLFYSTPDCYLKAVKDSNPILPTKQDDFFPYASDPTAYWTGYFTSRPTTKFFERQGNRFLQMVKHLQILGGLEEHNKFVLNELKSAMGVMQHHDAITGTEKQHVAHDYERLLDVAIEDALFVARQAFNKIAQRDALKPPLLSYDRCRFNESSCHTSETSRQFVVTIYNPLGWMVMEPIHIPVLNATYEVYAPNGEKITSQLIDIPEPVKKIPTRKSGATHELVFIAKLHPLGVKSFYVKKITKKSKRDVISKTNDYYGNINDYWKNLHDNFVEIHNLDDGKDYKIKEEQIPLPISRVDTKINIEKGINVDILKDKDDNSNVKELERIIKEAKTETVGRARSLDKKRNYPILNEEELRMLADEPTVVERMDEDYLENEYMKIRIDNTGVTHMILPDRTTNLKVQLFYWTGCFGNNTNTSERSSGAYIFRPQTTVPYSMTYRNTGTVKGEIVQEFRAETKENAASVLRLYNGLNYFVHDFVVGPIPVDDKVGKEYVVRYNTNVVNNGEFYTDSNGRQMLKRKLNERPQWNLTLEEPIAGNYYPVTNKISIQDDQSRISILTDRSEGGSSLEEGSIELMLHRRLLHDDAFGVGEALNEVAQGVGLVMRGQHKILNHNPDNHMELIAERKLVIQTHLQPIVFVSNADNIKLDAWMKLDNCFKGMKELPNGLHLLTLEPWTQDSLLLRFENYIDKSNNSTLQVDLSEVFNNIKIISIKETTLAANQWLGDVEKWTWRTENEFSESFNFEYNNFNSVPRARNVDEVAADDGLKIKIKAKQIRTFIAKYELIAS
ncbi:lysosomal alpha-mannosidase-like isoform X2 [Nymphalis io]|uniref:lysosomal alpha-mannosidase-like isoform X2 n=1 Tax=Inachis io TaxID=171585 RepID=UPI00216A87D7|nr:lysosomal alpha-mannosidase-like isoform X2 [Nymphalis io]